MAALALSVADRAYVLQSGTIRQSGPAATLRTDPAIVQAYLGDANPLRPSRPPLAACGERVRVRGGPARDAPSPSRGRGDRDVARL